MLKILKTSAVFKPLLTFHLIVNNPLQTDIFIISICFRCVFFLLARADKFEVTCDVKCSN